MRRIINALSLTGLSLAGLTPLAAAELNAPVLVADFSPGSNGGVFAPGLLDPIGGQLYFVNYEPQHGIEPWVSDGTVAGTRRLADLCPGPCSSFIRDFAAIGDRVVFMESPGNLYALEDGNLEWLGGDLTPGKNFQQLGSVLYFSAFHQGASQLFRTDGHREGTGPATELCPDTPICATTSGYLSHGGALYYHSVDQLYRYSGPGERRALAALQSARSFTPLDATRLVFEGCASPGDCRPWVTNGTSAGTFPLAATPVENLRQFLAWQGRVYFDVLSGPIHSTNGTPAGTRVEAAFKGPYPQLQAATPGRLFYRTGEPGNLALWSHDGASFDVRIANLVSFLQLNGVRGDQLFYTTLDGPERYVNATDGTVAGTVQLVTGSADAPSASFGDYFYFTLDRGNSGGYGLWRSDGTPDGTTELAFEGQWPYSSRVASHRLGGSLLAAVATSFGANALWRIDPQSLAATPIDNPWLTLAHVGNEIAYARNSADFPTTLTAISEDSVVELTSAAMLSETAIAADGKLYFTDSTPGQELWESDGTPGGTRELFDLHPGWEGSCLGCDYPLRITPSGDNVFFYGFATGEEQPALWRWKRGDAAPQLVRPMSSGPELIPVPGDRVVFRDLREGLPALWLSDGTAAGTRPLMNLPLDASIGRWAVAGTRLFFSLDLAQSSAVPRSELWVSDLTPGGSFRLTAEPDREITELAAAGDHLFFAGSAAGGPIGRELGFSDGTPAGTRWLDLKSGPLGSYAGGSDAGGFYVIDDQRVVFAAAADAAGDELWISDGTAAGTTRLTDLAPGEQASSPKNFAQVGNRLFFQATDGETGNELWALDLPPARPGCPQDRLCLQNGRFEVEVEVLAAGQTYAGQRELVTAESGVVSFFSPDNWEMQVKVLDGCAINQAFWVYASAATDLPYVLKVTDRAAGTSRSYPSAAGPAKPILDSAAFATCGAPEVAAAYSPAEPSAAAARRCDDDASLLCLGPEGRYKIYLDWQTSSAHGQAMAVPTGSADSGLFTFFSPSNWEMMVKVLDGCAINGKRWVFAAGTTDVIWRLTVEDRLTGSRKTYGSEVHQPAPTVTDLQAFDCN